MLFALAIFWRVVAFVTLFIKSSKTTFSVEKVIDKIKQRNDDGDVELKNEF